MDVTLVVVHLAAADQHSFRGHLRSILPSGPQRREVVVAKSAVAIFS
jgi:hypothetical protein